MDPQGVVLMALEVALEAKREETGRMEASLRADFVAFVDKVKNRSMLLTVKQDLIAKEAPKAKFVEDFMVFIEAIENGHLHILNNFDEKTMINTVSTMMNSDAGNIGGLVGEYEQCGAMVDATKGTNSVGNGP
ncbi:hypothetical protein GQ457_02G031690 [Hibiscus cannabinus]